MNLSDVVVTMLSCLVLILFLTFFGKYLKALIRILSSGFIGAVSFILVNAVLTPFGLSVGLNLMTICIVAFLGLPGFITLYITSFALNVL